MQSFFRSIALAGLLGLSGGLAHAADTTINVLYANDRTTAEAHDEIKGRFEAENPGIKINFLAPADSYETATQNVLRGALIGDLPDVLFQGQNLIRSLVDRNLAVPLNSFIEADG